MTRMHRWEHMDSVKGARVSEARMEAHFAVQWLERVADRLLPAQPDHSHTSLGWDHRLSALSTHPLPTRRGPIRLALHLPGLCYQIIDEAGVVEELPVTDRTHLAAGKWLQQALSGYGAFVPTLLDSADLPISDHYVARAERYQAYRMGKSLQALARWFGNAALVLEEVKADLDAGQKLPGPSPVRCWPHQFDMATLVNLEAGNADTTPAVRLGFSPGDAAIALPYFYVTPWPPLAVAHLPRLPSPGRWETNHFVGAIADADAIANSDHQHAKVRVFLSGSFERCRERLSRLEAVA